MAAPLPPTLNTVCEAAETGTVLKPSFGKKSLHEIASFVFAQFACFLAFGFGHLLVSVGVCGSLFIEIFQVGFLCLFICLFVGFFVNFRKPGYTVVIMLAIAPTIKDIAGYEIY